MIKYARRYHKWLMAFLGVQFLIWSVTGLYMVSINIHEIHGESKLKETDKKLKMVKANYPIEQIQKRYPLAIELTMTTLVGQPVYRIRTAIGRTHLVSIRNGKELGLVNRKKAIQIASHYYSGQSPIKSATLIDEYDDKLNEISPRHIPAWKIAFNDLIDTSFYVSQSSGELTAVRHNYWRLFDWMWRFHIMDYKQGDQVSNWLLRIAAIFSLISAAAGAYLTVANFTRNKQRDNRDAA